ncbi:MAG: DNA mismatch repair endonuclease MutL [Planctomycetes bacterium]|nr:DNA mismatch repair endonuclease MutL [Planctomycetota bacterium]
MGVIQKLDPHLVNQIAAGEVIERPASVVKELIENALDAEASRLEIEVEEGGRKLIRVTDDGVGMDADDLALAVSSHATSKLRSSNDLDHITTFGFRGEALPSIGSVSQMTVTTRQAEAVEGHSVRVEGGRIEPVRVAGSAPGTSIEVRNLFYNIPARRKFLKADATELGHIVDTVARMALAYPHVAVRLRHNGRLVHDLPHDQSLRDRVSTFYGRDVAESLIELKHESVACGLWGLIAAPSQSRTSTRWQFLYVNGRYIRDRSLLHAVREAYRGLVEVNRQPVVFLFLTVPHDSVDVNVHPTKIEVRLRHGQQVYHEVLTTLRERLLNADLTPHVGDGLTSPDDRSFAAPGVGDREQRIRESLADFLRAPPAQSPQTRFTYAPTPRGDALPPRSSPLPQGQPPAFPPQGDTAARSDETTNGDATDIERPRMRAFQLHNTYLVAETEDGMIIVDQHALHERVLYEELRDRVAGGQLESQRLLIPAVVDATASEMAFLTQHRDALARLGVEFEVFGNRSVGIQAFPSMLGQRAQPDRVLRDLLDWMAENDSQPAVEDLLDELLHRMACRAAVKAGDTLSQEEMQALLAHRHGEQQSATCPHGRPTSLMLTRDEIERSFKRNYPTSKPTEDDTIPF